MSFVLAVAQRLIGKSKKMKKKVFEVDPKMVDEKSRKVAGVIDGMTIPAVFAIIGTVVLEMVGNAGRQGYDIRKLVCDWLKSLEGLVMDVKMEPEVEEDERFCAN